LIRLEESGPSAIIQFCKLNYLAIMNVVVEFTRRILIGNIASVFSIE